ncbi:hypothetical protein OsI_27707 [Oryza sativa Indica Group]|uniref:Glycerol-3-phosphate acyltransferase RAM2/GPAT1-8 HAD-like domain-containing protein n=1 Tax=Oryza sativa subsp. indica TaxID=39946 RepID=B8BAG8_ORYSI|nr:hypothetical protein OsI_27707 [Oryza sativa Indica Group]
MATHQRRHPSVAAELEGTLLISGDLFPYFLLVALEAGGPLRAAVLLAAYPVAALLGVALPDDDLAVRVMTFVSTAGLAVADVAAVARATLPRFFLADLSDAAFRAFARRDAAERYVVTRLPTAMVEPFVREYVAEGARVVGAELRVVGGRFTGAVVNGDRSLGALQAVLGRGRRVIDVGLCSGDGAAKRQPAFMKICQERHVVSTPEKAPAAPLPRSEYLRPPIFHDGRLPLRRVGDIAPIPTVRLTRDRGRDRVIMQSVLAGGDLAVCPEGTTCREPYLLRFSPLFAEIAGEVTPVAVRAGGAMFHGTTVRGYKGMDSFFFLMNPAPWYHLQLLDPVPSSSAAADGDGGGDGGGESSRDVANRVQRAIGDALGFECTALTRRDKYRMIAGHDGVDMRGNARL